MLEQPVITGYLTPSWDVSVLTLSRAHPLSPSPPRCSTCPVTPPQCLLGQGHVGAQDRGEGRSMSQPHVTCLLCAHVCHHDTPGPTSWQGWTSVLRRPAMSPTATTAPSTCAPLKGVHPVSQQEPPDCASRKWGSAPRPWPRLGWGSEAARSLLGPVIKQTVTFPQEVQKHTKATAVPSFSRASLCIAGHGAGLPEGPGTVAVGRPGRHRPSDQPQLCRYLGRPQQCPTKSRSTLSARPSTGPACPGPSPPVPGSRGPQAAPRHPRDRLQAGRQLGEKSSGAGALRPALSGGGGGRGPGSRAAPTWWPPRPGRERGANLCLVQLASATQPRNSC